MAHPSSSNIPDHRKKWDVAEFEEKARDRIQTEKDEKEKELDKARRGGRPPRGEPKIKREELKPRSYTVRLLLKIQ